MGLMDISRHLCQPRKRRQCQGRWIWRMRRRGRDISSQTDYLLVPERNRWDFQGVTLKAPRHHNTNHQAVIATINAGSAAKLARYRRKRCRFPISMPKNGTRTYAETSFEWLKQECEPPPPWERKQNSWIQLATWALVDARALLRKEGLLTKQLS